MFGAALPEWWSPRSAGAAAGVPSDDRGFGAGRRGTPLAGTPVASDAPVPVAFPRDDGPHDAGVEWWYFTGHLFTRRAIATDSSTSPFAPGTTISKGMCPTSRSRTTRASVSATTSVCGAPPGWRATPLSSIST